MWGPATTPELRTLFDGVWWRSKRDVRRGSAFIWQPDALWCACQAVDAAYSILAYIWVVRQELKLHLLGAETVEGVGARMDSHMGGRVACHCESMQEARCDRAAQNTLVSSGSTQHWRTSMTSSSLLLTSFATAHTFTFFA